MDNQSRWTEGNIINGICEIELSSWRHFHDYVIEEMLDYSHYVWRGQRDATWSLKSSLDRLFEKHQIKNPTLRSKDHLEAFKKATRGRRGANPATIHDENEWWALGQHNGLATPLLDWSESPFVGLYFAFEKVEAPTSGKRAVWAMSELKTLNQKANADTEWKIEPKTLTYVRPNQNENPRLLSQAGLFTRGPAGITADGWVRKFSAGNNSEMELIKITIPDAGRKECLLTLNKMNINHATLFPDLYGAGTHCNKSIELDDQSNV